MVAASFRLLSSDFGNCLFEISVYFIHIFHLLAWCDVLGNSPLAGYSEAIIQ